MADRRTVLRGLAALPLAGTALAAPAEAEPIAAEVHLAALLARYRAAVAVQNDPTTSDDSGDEAYGEMMQAVETGAELAPLCRTLAGATTALEWVRIVFLDHLNGSAVDHLDVLTLRFLDGALGVLRSTTTGGQAYA